MYIIYLYIKFKAVFSCYSYIKDDKIKNMKILYIIIVKHNLSYFIYFPFI